MNNNYKADTYQSPDIRASLEEKKSQLCERMFDSNAQRKVLSLLLNAISEVGISKNRSYEAISKEKMGMLRYLERYIDQGWHLVKIWKYYTGGASLNQPNTKQAYRIVRKIFDLDRRDFRHIGLIEDRVMHVPAEDKTVLDAIRAVGNIKIVAKALGVSLGECRKLKREGRLLEVMKSKGLPRA